MKRAEVVFVAATLFVAAAAIAADRIVSPRAQQEQAPSAFFSESFYCPSPGPEQAGEGADSIVFTTNFGEQSIQLRRSSAGNSGISRSELADLAPGRRTEISAASLGIAGAAQIVEAFGPGSATQQLLRAPNAGVASAACSLGPSNRWYFASGSTVRGKDTYLLLANPFEEEARVRVRIITQNEDILPSLLEDLIVPALTETPVLVAEFFQETESFGIDVKATRGRVVVSRFQSFGPPSGFRGTTLTLGARRAASRWLFAGGQVPASGEETLVLLNPGESEALIRISFPTESETVAPPELQEFALPAGRQAEFVVSAHLARGTVHGIEASSSNAVPFVAERLIAGPSGADSAIGVNEPRRKWGVAVGSPAPGSDLLALFNPSRLRALVSVSIITGDVESRPPQLAAIAVEAAHRATVDLGPFLGGRPATALVEAVSGEIVAEHLMVAGDPYRDFAWSPGAPLR